MSGAWSPTLAQWLVLLDAALAELPDEAARRAWLDEIVGLVYARLARSGACAD